MPDRTNHTGRLIATSPSDKGVPLYRFAEASDYAGWLKTAPHGWRNWLDAHNFAESFASDGGGCLPLPDSDGRIAAAVIADSSDPVTTGGVASRLPTGRYHLQPAPAQPPTNHAANNNLGLFALGWVLEGYRYQRFRQTPSQPAQANLVVGDADILRRVQVLAEATCLVRDLINTPANILTPQGLEDATRTLAKQFSAKFSVVKGNALAKQFPAIHTVGRSAETPPRMLELHWGEGLPITLIGKGVTFDSGGLNIKPDAGMYLMKKDMGGAAHVLGIAQAIMALGLKVKLRVLIGAAENAVSSRAMRPLDVIDTAAGIPVEIGHTDAEGRLLLADMLHYATQGATHRANQGANHNASTPALVIDFATLTGAARIALGTDLPAMFANDDEIAESLLHHAQHTQDPMWRLPLHAPYAKQLHTASHALSSTGASRYGGAITAALFLQKFLAGRQKWVHCDVMAWNMTARPARPIGGEAMGLRAVVSFIEEIATTSR